MAKKNKPQPEFTPEENLDADNALAALNLEMRYGAKMHLSDEVPPEMLQQFLANVTAFENDHHSNGATTTVYQRIGEPPFATPDLLETATLPGEVKRLLDILEQNDLVVLRPDNLDDLVFYNFLVSEIFPLEITANVIPGIVHCLDYADFHPDETLLIAQIVEVFLLRLLNLKEPFFGELLSETCRDDLHEITREQALQIIADFRGRYETIIPVAFHIEELIESGSGPFYQTFLVRWKGIPPNGAAEELHEGLGVMMLDLENEEWLVQGVNMPGFKF